MPHLPLPQQLYLGGVICAFAVFMLTMAWGRFQSMRRTPQPQRGWRSAQAGQVGEGGAVGQTQAARAFEAKRA